MAYFVSHDDKTYSLTDCISFVIMQGRAISEALTFDVHFTQAGFQVVSSPPNGRRIDRVSDADRDELSRVVE